MSIQTKPSGASRSARRSIHRDRPWHDQFCPAAHVGHDRAAFQAQHEFEPGSRIAFVRKNAQFFGHDPGIPCAMRALRSRSTFTGLARDRLCGTRPRLAAASSGQYVSSQSRLRIDQTSLRTARRARPAARSAIRRTAAARSSCRTVLGCKTRSRRRYRAERRLKRPVQFLDASTNCSTASRSLNFCVCRRSSSCRTRLMNRARRCCR